MITKENYEEYFLLYIDNELSMTDRAAVERFVDDNPLLREEFVALLECRMLPEQPEPFPGKELLLQQDLISYIDGELDEEGNRAVQEFIGLHPAKAMELEQLLLTVSEPDLLVTFPDKESLYRKERERRILYMPWVRAGIAAAVIGLVAGVGLIIRHGNNPVVAKIPARTNTASPITSATNNTAPANDAASANNTTATTNKKFTQPVTPAVSSPLHSTGSNDQPAEQKALAKDNTTKRKEKQSIPLPVPAETTTTTDNHPNEQVLVAEIKPEAAKETIVKPALAATAVNIPKEQSSFATQALMEEAQGDDAKEMVATAPAGKSKLRGIFRRVTRTFGKTADRDSDGQKEVLISAFQVALK